MKVFAKLAKKTKDFVYAYVKYDGNLVTPEILKTRTGGQPGNVDVKATMEKLRGMVGDVVTLKPRTDAMIKLVDDLVSITAEMKVMLGTEQTIDDIDPHQRSNQDVSFRIGGFVWPYQAIEGFEPVLIPTNQDQWIPPKVPANLDLVVLTKEALDKFGIKESVETLFYVDSMASGQIRYIRNAETHTRYSTVGIEEKQWDFATKAHIDKPGLMAKRLSTVEDTTKALNTWADSWSEKQTLIKSKEHQENELVRVTNETKMFEGYVKGDKDFLAFTDLTKGWAEEHRVVIPPQYHEVVDLKKKQIILNETQAGKYAIYCKSVEAELKRLATKIEQVSKPRDWTRQIELITPLMLSGSIESLGVNDKGDIVAVFAPTIMRTGKGKAKACPTYASPSCDCLREPSIDYYIGRVALAIHNKGSCPQGNDCLGWGFAGLSYDKQISWGHTHVSMGEKISNCEATCYKGYRDVLDKMLAEGNIHGILCMAQKFLQSSNWHSQRTDTQSEMEHMVCFEKGQVVKPEGIIDGSFTPSLVKAVYGISWREKTKGRNGKVPTLARL